LAAEPTKPEPRAGAGDLRRVPGLEDFSKNAPLAPLFEKSDPKKDPQWSSEVLSEIAVQQLKALALAMEKAGAPDAEAVSELVGKDYVSGPFRPSVGEVHRDSALVVRRASAEVAPAALTSATFADGLAALTSIYPDGTEVHTKFKITRVATRENTAETVSYVQSGAQTPWGIAQQSATWTCHWKATAKVRPPLPTKIEVAGYEEVLPLKSLEAPSSWLARHPRFHLHFTLTSASWLKRSKTAGKRGSI